MREASSTDKTLLYVAEGDGGSQQNVRGNVRGDPQSSRRVFDLPVMAHRSSEGAGLGRCGQVTNVPAVLRSVWSDTRVTTQD